MELLDIPNHIKVAAKLMGGAENIFFQICEGLSLVEDKSKYPNTIFLLRGDKLVFELNIKTMVLWCSYPEVWSFLEKECSGNYNDTQSLIKSLVEEHFKLKGVTPLAYAHRLRWTVEEHFKLKGVTPVIQDQENLRLMLEYVTGGQSQKNDNLRICRLSNTFIP